MPANLTPQYLRAEERYKEALTTADKQKALRQMMSVIPKHKGTEKLVAELRRKLSRLQDEIEFERKSRGGGHAPGHVPREGAGQVVLVGAPNAGKSSLLGTLTRAEAKIAAYPFTTHEPQSGMMEFEDVHVQLVDTPPVSLEVLEPWLPELVRNADRALLVADLGSDAVLDDLEMVLRCLAERRVRLQPPGAAPPDASDHDAVETLVAASQCDRPGAVERAELLREMLPQLLGDTPPENAVHIVSCHSRDGLEGLRRALFDSLQVIRIYTKMPGHKPDLMKPFVLPRGSTVNHLAETIHKDIAASLRFARVWGSGKFDGQSVHHDHVLEDRDVIEIHA